MPLVVWQTIKEPRHAPAVKAKIQAFLSKLQQDDTTLGLHIEPIANSKDPRVRTGRVDQSWRALLFKFDPPGSDPVYVYAGTWPHDDAIAKAKVTVARQNPVNSLVAFTEELEAVGTATVQPGTSVNGHVPAPSVTNQPSAESGKYSDSNAREVAQRRSILQELRLMPSDLTETFGFAPEVADRAFACSSEDALLDLAASLPDLWQQDVLLAMGAGIAIHEILASLQLEPDETPAAHEDENLDEDTRIVEALKHPAAQMQFHFIEDDEDLRRIIDDGDFGAWRVFLHPEQRRYVSKNYNGAFRLSGGAGTGKTVVLLHRTRWLHKQNPAARIVLTTFSRALAENLKRDLQRLDPSIVFAKSLGESGVAVRGVDQLASEIRKLAGSGFASATQRVLGSTRDSAAKLSPADWQSAIDNVDMALPPGADSPSFYEAEYAQVILPAGITAKDEYYSVRRPGRGVALDRAKRAAVWQVVTQMRSNERLLDHIDYGEAAACASGWLLSTNTHLADHVLVDEGQDLEPAKWQLLRRLVPEGKNDLFIADDSHQRIYGQPTVFSRYGIAIRGRSRRLTLNYRTTLENLRYAVGVLEGIRFSDSEGEAVTVAGYRSVRTGPEPRVHQAGSEAELLQVLAADLAGWREKGIPGETVAILVASNYQGTRVHQGLEALGELTTIVTSSPATGSHPRILTMQRAKGLEFSRVVLFDVSQGSFPPAAAVRGLEGADLEDRLQQFRSQLYVAASRARDELVVTWVKQPSHLLSR